MTFPTPVPVQQGLRQVGRDLGTWRRLRRLTSVEVAERAGVSRATLSRLEAGHGATLETVLRVSRALGVLSLLVDALDPYRTDVGRLRADEALPVRVRHRAAKPASDGTSPKDE